jgi:hypothetical protein
MRYFEKNGTGKNQIKNIKTAVLSLDVISVKRLLGLLLFGLIVGVLCSFTIIENKEEEPAEQHNYGNEIELTEPSVYPVEDYAIKIFRYFELFPHMRAYLYRFEHTDIKKVCEQKVTPVNNYNRKVGEMEIYPSPENGMSMFIVFTNSGAYEMDVVNTNGQDISHHTIVTDANINHNLNFSQQIAPGIYYLTVRAGDDVVTGKVTLKGS